MRGRRDNMAGNDDQGMYGCVETSLFGPCYGYMLEAELIFGKIMTAPFDNMNGYCLS